MHDWRSGLVHARRGARRRSCASSPKGKLDFTWPAQVDKLLVEGGFDLILSIGQVVPHEVIGMANYNKNVFVGTGGAEGINKSHYLGAVYGMERIMGRADTPVRRVLNYASDHFATALADRLRPDGDGQERSGQAGSARPVRRRRCGVLRAGRPS